MLDTLITSRTRIKLLLKFFSNSSNEAYLRSLAEEFGESTNGVRVELNRLADAGLLKSEPSGNTILYKANMKSPMFPEIRNMVTKHLGFYRIVEQVVKRLGSVELALIIGSCAKGVDNREIDLVLVGAIDQVLLSEYADKTEKMLKRNLRFSLFNEQEFASVKDELLNQPHIVIWGQIPE